MRVFRPETRLREEQPACDQLSNRLSRRSADWVMAGSHHTRHRWRTAQKVLFKGRHETRTQTSINDPRGVLSIVQLLWLKDVTKHMDVHPIYILLLLIHPAGGPPIGAWSCSRFGPYNIQGSWFIQAKATWRHPNTWGWTAGGGHGCLEGCQGLTWPQMCSHTYTHIPPALTGPLNGWDHPSTFL